MELLPDDFYRMSWREFFLLYRGRNKKNENNLITQASFTREIAYQIYCTIPLGKNKKHISKSKYWALPEDKEREKEQLDLMRQTMDKLTNKAR